MADSFVDFKVVKERVSMESVLGHYNIRLRRVNQNSLRGLCPLPTHSSEKSKESFGVQTEKNIWACQSNTCVAARQGKRGGNVLDFVALMESCSIRDAAFKLHDWFLANAPAQQSATGKGSEDKVVAEKEVEQVAVAGEANKPLSFSLKDIDPKHEYLRKRGLSEETLQTFGVGFFPGKGMMAGRVVIPIHNERGELVA